MSKSKKGLLQTDNLRLIPSKTFSKDQYFQTRLIGISTKLNQVSVKRPNKALKSFQELPQQRQQHYNG